MVPEESHEPQKRHWIALSAVLTLVSTALLIYCRTGAFAWDEGYHLVAAWLIAHGHTPYIDFVFPQTPLNAYWNAFLLRVFGEDWRIPHSGAALLTLGAVAIAAFHVYRRLPASAAWRTSCAIVTAFAFCLNTAVFEFGSLQAYGMCLFMITGSYALTVRSVEGTSLARPALAGLMAGIAASSSLLSVPAGVVFPVWILIADRGGRRLAKAAAFVAGIGVALVPLALLLIRAPHQVIFGFLQYELLYRKVEWDGAWTHNLGEILTLGNSSQPVLLILGALAAIVLTRNRFRSELALCVWMTAIQTAYLLTARPTFTRYFLLAAPFLSIAAATGLREIFERISPRPRPWLAAAIICPLLAFGLAASLFEERDDMMWGDLEQTAKKVREVTPPSAVLLADETVYFLLRRTPPSGMELEDSHKLKFSDAEAAAVHVVPRPKLDLMIRAGRFDTIEMCDQDEVDRLELSSLYRQNADAGSCHVFWDRGKQAETPTTP